jgi:hypothetical protein
MQQNDLEFDGIIFPSALALHEYRLVFDFEYFSDLAEQNILNIQTTTKWATYLQSNALS